jgi:hypothetical protein
MKNYIVDPALPETEWPIIKAQQQGFDELKTMFPKGVNLEDIDNTVFEWFKARPIKIDNTAVPVIYLNNEKWAQYKNNWKYVDSNFNMKYPYIAIRRAEVQPGQEPMRSIIPNRKHETCRIPYRGQDGNTTYKIFKVPQPVRVDLDYEVRALSTYMTDDNMMNEALIKHFASLQTYIQANGYYMPMKIDSVANETDIDTIEDMKVIHTAYSIKVFGYLLDQEEFEEIVAPSRLTVNIEEEIL